MKHFITLVSSILIVAALLIGLFIYKRYTRIEYPAANHKERTLAIIKPDAVEKKYTGQIIDLIEKNDFSILSMKKIALSKHEAETFYAVHAHRPFFNDLITFMTSGPVVIMMLEKDNAITSWRSLMGSTNPKEAPEESLRKKFGTDVQKNALHGSDSPENAQLELHFFFPEHND